MIPAVERQEDSVCSSALASMPRREAKAGAPHRLVRVDAMALKLLLAPESEADACEDATRGIPLGDEKGPSRGESPGVESAVTRSGRIVAAPLPPCESWLLMLVS